ncbi:acetoacetyl-CoA reductase [Marinobacterium aestuariivivens]|uniref:Acetoacetyl-CoA reductase n=1 Tax=Marinobacterium aestuariivivens TaxID=1698799 RepID=A0ABW2A0R7_9GAMM
MSQKIALVTGGTGGIGTAICRRLADDGFKVIAGYSNAEKAERWQKTQQKEGYDFGIAYANVADFESCQRCYEEIWSQYGTVSVLVNNAGITRDASLRKMAPEQWNEVIQTNLNSVFNLSRVCLEAMLEQQYGRIINISSINGQKGQFGQTNYCAAKAGMHGFTKALAQEVASKGITVNTISPGYIATDMIMAVPEEIREQIRQQIPVKRFGKPEEIARTVAFLAAEDAGFITGSDLSVNGGQYMH